MVDLEYPTYLHISAKLIQVGVGSARTLRATNSATASKSFSVASIILPIVALPLDNPVYHNKLCYAKNCPGGIRQISRNMP